MAADPTAASSSTTRADAAMPSIRNGSQGPDWSDALISVVFPAYQEETFLPTAVADVTNGLRSAGRHFEVLVVENGSKDRTREVARELASEYPEVRALSIPTADYGLALREGLLQSKGTFVVNFDVDLYDLTFLDRALERIAAPGGPSIVVASKRGEDANDTRHWTRKAVTSVFTFLLRRGFGLKVSDTQIGRAHV